MGRVQSSTEHTRHAEVHVLRIRLGHIQPVCICRWTLFTMVRNDSQQGSRPPLDGIKSSSSSRVATTVANLNRTSGGSTSALPRPSKRKDVAIDSRGRFTIVDQDGKNNEPDLGRDLHGRRLRVANAPTLPTVLEKARADSMTGIERPQKAHLNNSKVIDIDDEFKTTRQKILAKDQGGQAAQSGHPLTPRSGLTNSHTEVPLPTSSTRYPKLGHRNAPIIIKGGGKSVSEMDSRSDTPTEHNQVPQAPRLMEKQAHSIVNRPRPISQQLDAISQWLDLSNTTTTTPPSQQSNVRKDATPTTESHQPNVSNTAERLSSNQQLNVSNTATIASGSQQRLRTGSVTQRALNQTTLSETLDPRNTVATTSTNQQLEVSNTTTTSRESKFPPLERTIRRFIPRGMFDESDVGAGTSSQATDSPTWVKERKRRERENRARGGGACDGRA